MLSETLAEHGIDLVAVPDRGAIFLVPGPEDGCL